MTGVTLARVQEMIDNILNQVHIRMNIPLRLALTCYWSVWNNLEHGQIVGAMREARAMQKHAEDALRYITYKGASHRAFMDASLAARVCMAAKLLVTSYDKETKEILPFGLISQDRKNMIANMMKSNMERLGKFRKSKTKYD